MKINFQAYFRVPNSLIADYENKIPLVQTLETCNVKNNLYC